MNEKMSKRINMIISTSSSMIDDLLGFFDELCYTFPMGKSVSVGFNPITVDMVYEIRAAQEKRRLKNAMRQIEKKKLAKIVTTGNRMRVVLTNKGKEQVLRSKIINCTDNLPGDDYCLICFDIPEHLRKIRLEWRRFLKKSGFEMLQRSVWLSKKNVVEPMENLIRMMKTDKWISIFQVRYHFL